jgi:hypothetical protein
MPAMSPQEQVLCRRAAAAVQAVKNYDLDPYTALWLTIRPTAKMLQAENGELEPAPVQKTGGKTLLPRTGHTRRQRVRD